MMPVAECKYASLADDATDRTLEIPARAEAKQEIVEYIACPLGIQDNY
jgi:hypothetical protein